MDQAISLHQGPNGQQEIQRFIKEQEALFWYIPQHKKSKISLDTLVEFILNYGDYEACKKLLSIVGTSAVADVFFSHIGSERRKQNYFPEIAIFFTQYFERHVPRSAES